MKPVSFSQLHVQIVIVVKYRIALLKNDFRDTLFKYISGIITNNGHKAIIVNGVEDHVHIFIGLNPKESISDLVRDIKKDSSKFINQNNLTPIRFHCKVVTEPFLTVAQQLIMFINTSKIKKNIIERRLLKMST